MKLIYTPTPKQKQFYAATEDEVLFGGAAGGGKTCAIMTDLKQNNQPHYEKEKPS